MRQDRPYLTRLILAATLGASYGLYGPAYELLENTPRESGSEEYMNSEKYEIKRWEVTSPDSLAPIIARVNHARKMHPALQSNDELAFHTVDNDQLIAYTKSSSDNTVLTVVNLDPHHTHRGWLELPLERFQ